MELVDSPTSISHPRCEPSALSIVISSSKVQFGSNQQDLLVKTYDSAVIQCVLVVHRHSNVTNDVLSQFWLLQDVCKHLPRVLYRVQLEEMVLAAIP